MDENPLGRIVFQNGTYIGGSAALAAAAPGAARRAGRAQLTLTKEAAARQQGEPRRLQVRRRKILRHG
jgi:hypothetical protein